MKIMTLHKDRQTQFKYKLTIAEDEAANTSERVKFVLDAKVRNKEPNTGTQPFGYKIEKIDGVKRIVKDPETEKETEKWNEFRTVRTKD